MSTKLFVGNLSFRLTEQELRDAFAPFGVISAEIVRDKYNGNSRGYGFVEMRDEDAAESAVRALHGHEMQHRPIRVEIANGKGPNGGGARRDSGEHRFRD